MPRQLLTIEVSRAAARHAVLRLTGELDFDTAPELIWAANQVRAEGHDELTVDLTHVTLCDSSGLSAIVVLYRDTAWTVRLTGMNRQVQHLLTRTGLAELLAGSRPDEDERAGLGPDGQVREVG
ncbi:STAS domain-containing protein [Micromonospora inyonensis]|uniref:Anti-anti-sigma factor n=1 Tax=Micromonospora inyonensis TaxID=47866 RepID=A0A1C6SHB6_9ACTN|nr:STAS domain-containing protein [Micromonospora inyonensis]SCL28833.1 anti-anti-sigma factor [Micromonospora inyonensis]